MENLFDLIFSNLWILVIIFGALSSMLGGENKKKKQQHRPVLDLPTMRTDKKDEPQTKMKTTSPKPEENTSRVPDMYSTAPKEPSILEEQLRQRQEMWAKQAAAASAVKTVARQGEEHPASEKTSELPSYSKNKLVTGIIMAEVLGPPRAKRPLTKRR